MALDSLILIYGNDATLLKTRRWVLEKAGFKVIAVSVLTAAQDAMTREPLGLFVLCHTLTVQERSAALKASDTLRPQMRKLSFCSIRQQIGTEEISGDIIENFAGAEALIAASWKLLQ